MLRHFFLSFLATTFSFSIFAATLTVTTTSDSGSGSLRNAIASAVNGDTIRFDATLLAGGNATIVLNSQISFAKNISIIGLFSSSDTLFLSGDGSNRIFEINATQNVTLDSLAFINAYANTNGGAIAAANVQNLFVQNCYFKNNEVTNPRRGGGIHCYGNVNSPSLINTLYVNNCKFYENTAQYGAGIGSSSYGNYSIVMVVENSIFNDNNCLFGGGIYHDNYTDSVLLTPHLTVNNCVMNGNVANSGGGICVTTYSHASADVHVTNSEFKNNDCSNSGGGIYYAIYSDTDGKLLVDACQIEDNQSSQGGGGIFLMSYSNEASEVALELSNSTIAGNTASNNGGGISVLVAGSSLANAFVEIEGSTISRNTASGFSSRGGGFYTSASNGNSSVNIRNSTIVNNQAASNNGGAVHATASNASLHFTSSIIALNGNVNIRNSNPNLFNSGGYNIFSDSTLVDAIASDQLGVDSLSLLLGNLNYNGGNTKTRAPLPGSVAINNGNPSDLVPAQNIPIVGIRDVGAAEACASSSTDVHVSCSAFTWIDGITYTASNNTAFYTLTNASACDSVVFLDLQISTPSSGVDVQSACGTFTWIDGNTYNASNNIATFTIPNGASNGCDSIVTLNLTINPTANGTDVISSCTPITWIDGNTYNTSNNAATFTIPNGASNGCDSIVNLDLTITSFTSGIDVITSCTPITWIDGNTYNTSNNAATFTIPNGASNGCDSLVTLNLTINSLSNGIDVITSCTPITWIDGNTYNTGNNTATFTIPNGASNACDSIVTLNLTINNSNTSTDNQTACDSLTWIDGISYTSSTSTPTFTLTNSVGCDSLVTLNLTINNSNTSTDTQTACDSYTWIDGITYTSSTSTPTFILTNTVGCDSLVTLNLTINNSNTGMDTQTACDSYTWIDGITYTSSTNAPTFTLTNAAACDSLVTLNLTIDNSNTGTDTQTACDSYTWIDGITYVASNNTATHTIIGGAANGCDSIVTLNLSLNYTEGHTFILTVCDSLTWRNGITYTQSIINEIFIVPGVAANGCDSVYVLDLTVIPSGSGTDVITACGSYTWMDGITYTASTNTPTSIVQGGNTNGCNAVMSLDLTILQTPTITITDSNGIYLATPGLANYQWFRNGQLLVGEINSTIDPTLFGGYTCETSNGTCVGISNMIVKGVTGIGFVEFEDIRIYPNPAQDYLNIEIGQEEVNTIKMFDVVGKLVRDMDIEQTRFYMGDYAKGMYFIELANEEQRSLVKLVLK